MNEWQIITTNITLLSAALSSSKNIFCYRKSHSQIHTADCELQDKAHTYVSKWIRTTFIILNSYKHKHIRTHKQQRTSFKRKSRSVDIPCVYPVRHGHCTARVIYIYNIVFYVSVCVWFAVMCTNTTMIVIIVSVERRQQSKHNCFLLFTEYE